MALVSSFRAGGARRKRVKVADIALIACASIVCAAILYFAEEDFSYDHHAYIEYFNVLDRMSLSGIWDAFWTNLPFPYVSLPPDVSLEAGFAFVAWTLDALTGDPYLTYAILGALSIGVRSWVARQMGASWLATFALAVYSITLFEANAIRLGIATTGTLLGIFLLSGDSQRRSWGLALIGLSFLFHIQALYFSSFFILLYLLHRSYARRQVDLLLVCAALVAAGVSTVWVLSEFGPSKMEDYLGSAADASGFNLMSIAASLLLALAIAAVLNRRNRAEVERCSPQLGRIWTAILLGSIPSVAVLLTATTAGALGGRVWQQAFAILAYVGLAWWQRKEPANRYITNLVGIAIAVVLCASIVNITLRYPASNFFYPLLPYREFIHW